jgi:hypothetical protein
MHTISSPLPPLQITGEGKIQKQSCDPPLSKIPNFGEGLGVRKNLI